MKVHLIKLADEAIGTPICFLLGLVSKVLPKAKIKTPKKVLAIQFWGIGETLLVLPALKALREIYKDAEISVLATSRVKDVFEGQEYIDNLIVIDTNIKGILGFISKNLNRYDLVIDFEEYLNISSIISFFVGKYRIGYNNRIRRLILADSAEYNDKQHVVETHMDLVRLLSPQPKVDSLIKLYYSKEDEGFINNYLNHREIKPKDFLVSISPGAAESAKSRIWPLKNYAELADRLIEQYHAKVVFVGAPNEKDPINTIINQMKSKNNVFTSAGHLSVKQLFCLLEKSKLVISNDSGPMHIGAAMDSPTIGLFGPNLPIRWRPFNNKSTYIYKGDICPYSPCINVHRGQVPECLQPSQNNICMKNIKVEDVMSTVNRIILDENILHK